MNREMPCQVCGQNDSKYTCPACNIRTCSVECIKRHKKETGCTGTKLKTTFVPVEKMNSDMLIKDCVLIDEVRSAVIDANLKFPKSKKKKGQQLLEKQCQERGITIRFMPHQMDRSKENRSYYNKKDQIIYWSCKFRFRNENKDIMYERLIHNQAENLIIQDLFNAVVETSPNDFAAKANLNEFEILLLAEGAPGGGHYQIIPTVSLGDNFFLKTIIEYPIFDIVPKSSLDEWNIVSDEDIRKFEEQKETPTVVKQKPLPSYESIKEALKLDIITSVLKTSKLKDEQNAPLPPDFNSNSNSNDTPM